MSAAGYASPSLPLAPRAIEKSKVMKGKGDLDMVKLCHSSGATAELYLWGATLCSYKTSDDAEHIFVSPGALFDGKKAIRGGVPVVFPQFGQPDKIMAQHGFARTSFWALKSLDDNFEESTIVLTLVDSEATRSVWNHKFSLEYVVTLSAVSLKMTLRITNTGDVPFNFQALLHTYFKIPEISNVSIRGLSGRSYLDKAKDNEMLVEGWRWSDGHWHFVPDFNIPSYFDRVYLSGEMVAGSASKDVVIINKDAPGISTCNEGRINGAPMPVEVVVWNPYEVKSPGDLPVPAYKEFVCVEPGLIGHVTDGGWVEKHLLPEGATAELSQKIMPSCK